MVRLHMTHSGMPPNIRYRGKLGVNTPSILFPMKRVEKTSVPRVEPMNFSWSNLIVGQTIARIYHLVFTISMLKTALIRSLKTNKCSSKEPTMPPKLKNHAFGIDLHTSSTKSAKPAIG